MGHVIGTLPEGEPVRGVTSLENRLYVLRGSKASDQIEVYDVDSYRLVHCLTVPKLGTAYDILACAHYRCVYISDTDISHNCVHRVALPGAAITQWPVNDQPYRLSLTDKHSVVVTCHKVHKIKQFTTDGQLLREVILPQDFLSPCHAFQLSSGEFIVCHGDRDDPLHRVCLIGTDGHFVKSYGGSKGSGSQQMNVPIHMAVDRIGFVFVADANNNRVLLLSPTLTYVREVVSREQLQWLPRSLSIDVARRRLYVADNEYKDGKYTVGRVIVVNV